MKPIRIAIIGFGKIAADQHVPSIVGNGRFELAATSSRSGNGPSPSFTNWRQLLREVDGLEAVAITTPPGPRYEIARECILAGLHCLLEKPPTAGLTQINDLACLAEAQQVTLFTTWHAQHHATVRAAARALAARARPDSRFTHVSPEIVTRDRSADTTAVNRIVDPDGAPFVPSDEGDFEILLEAYLLDKAVYEVGYELNNRPDWVVIPIRGIKHILGAA